MVCLSCLGCSGPHKSPFRSVDLGGSWQVTPPAALSLSPVTEGHYMTLRTAGYLWARPHQEGEQRCGVVLTTAPSDLADLGSWADFVLT